MWRAELRGTRCYVELLAAQTGPLNSLCPDGPTAQLVIVSLDKDFAASKHSELVERLSEVVTL